MKRKEFEMFSFEQALSLTRDSNPNFEVGNSYEDDGFYYISLIPKGIKEGEFYDSLMFKVDKNSGEIGYLNYVELIVDGTAENLRSL